MRRSHLCEHCDSCEVSIWRPCFNIDLPCLESYLLIFQVSLSHLSAWSFPLFWFSPSDFSSQTFQFFWVSASHFFESTLHFSESVLTVFFWSFLPFLGSELPIFSSRTFAFFWVSPSNFLESDFPILFSWLLFNWSKFILQFVGFIRRCLWLEMSTEIVFFNYKTGWKKILANYFYVGFTYTEILGF